MSQNAGDEQSAVNLVSLNVKLLKIQFDLFQMEVEMENETLTLIRH